MILSIFAQGPGITFTTTPGYYLLELPARLREKGRGPHRIRPVLSCASASFATELSSNAMLASIAITPGNGLVASKYMPLTNPASPPSKTAASSTSSHFVNMRVLPPWTRSQNCWWGAARALALGVMWG